MVALVHPGVRYSGGVYGPEISVRLAQWAARQIPHVGEGSLEPCQAIGIAAGVEPADEVYGVIVFHEWQEKARTMQITVAARSPRWVWGCKRAYRYVFDQIGAYKIWTATPHRHERAIRWNLGIGFKREAVLRHHFGPGVHAVICSMLEPEYRASRWCDKPKQEKAA